MGFKYKTITRINDINIIHVRPKQFVYYVIFKILSALISYINVLQKTNRIKSDVKVNTINVSKTQIEFNRACLHERNKKTKKIINTE